MMNHGTRILVFMLGLVPVCLHASGYVPDVYQDEYVTIRAGIPAVGREPIHIGDSLSLVLEAEFNEGQVVLENLGEEFFTRGWGSEKGISLLETPDVTRTGAGSGATRLKGTYRFQILDCPGEMPSCPGHKVYALPVFTLGYQIIDQAGEILNNKSIRFRPWPGQVNVTQALPVNVERPGEFSDYFPAGAYPSAIDLGKPGNTGLWTALFGGLMVVASFTPLLYRDRLPGRPERARNSSRRWERALAVLQEGSAAMPDEEWVDLLRRSATWYCLDELGANPYTWLNDGSDAGDTQVNGDFRAFFLEVLNQEGVAPGDRRAFLDRFRELSGSALEREAA